MQRTLFRKLALVLTALGAPSVTAAQQCEQFKLLASDGQPQDLMGRSAAVEDSLAVFGAPWHGDDGVRSGAAFVFDTASGSQIAELRPDDGAPERQFGTSVAVQGTKVLVGAIRPSGVGSGAAYLFNVATGQQIARYTAGKGDNRFGQAVAMNDDVAVIGAQLADTYGFDSGTAYLFDITTGQLTFELLRADGASGDRFGFAVAISGGIAAVGAYEDDDRGSVYLFDVAMGAQLHKLRGSDTVTGDNFGYSVAISGGTVLVGAQGDDDNGVISGSAYLFDAGTGQELMKLLPNDGEIAALFGCSVALDGNRALIGARGATDNGAASGAIYTFDATTGAQLDKLLPADGEAFDGFGWSVALDGTTAVAGAHEEANMGTGAGYLFREVCELGSRFCVGDAGCPCGNDDPSGTRGCVTSTGAGIALAGSGSRSVSADDLVLTATGCPPRNNGLIFMGGTTFAPVFVQDGLQCTGGLHRFLPGASDAGGSLSQTGFVAAAPPNLIQPGDTRHFQFWTRDVLCGPPPSPCPTPCGNGSNLSNGYSVGFVP